MTQRWCLSHHRDEPFSVHLTEVPRWAAAVEAAAETVDWLVRHRWCDPWEWTFRVPLWPGRDRDGDWRHSLGSALSTSFQLAARVTFRRERVDVLIPISRQQAEAIDPDVVREWT